MKRVMSFIAIVALIVTMFTGVALAATDVTIVVDKETIELNGNNSGMVHITGRIVDSNGATVSTNNKVWVRSDADGLIGQKISADNGRFDIVVFESMLPVGTYTVRMDSDPDTNYTFDSSGSHDDFRVVPEIEITDGTLNLTYPVPIQPVLMGHFPNEDGDDFTLKIAYISGDHSMGSSIATAVSNSRTFGFLMSSSDMENTGEIGLFANGVLVKKGKISPAELNVSLVTEKVQHSLGEQPIVLDFSLDSKYTDGDVLDDNYNLYMEYEIEESNVLKTKEIKIVGNSGSSLKFIDKSKQTAAFDLPCDDWDKGNFEFKVQLRDGSKVVKEKELEIKIVDPKTYTLLGWGLEEAGVGDITFGFPSISSGTFPSDSTIKQDVRIVKYKSDESPEVCRYVELRAEGCGVDKVLKNFGDNSLVSANMGTISPTETGEIDIKIYVYSDENDKSPNVTFTETIKVTGYNVEISRDAFEVESTDDLVITVTDEEGAPVNNAIIILGDKLIVSGSTSSITNGVYIYEDDDKHLFEEVGQLTLNVSGYRNGKRIEINFEDAIDVTGQREYVLASDTKILVNGAQEDVYISTIDKSGNVIYPTYERIDIDAEGNKSKPKSISGGSYKDLDGDGVKESAKLTILPNFNQREMIIRASTDGGKKMGEVKFSVQPPRVVMEKTSIATENIKSELKFKIVDPRNNEVLDNDIYFETDEKYVDFSLRDGSNYSVTVNNGKSSTEGPDSDDVYEFTIIVDDVDWDKAEDNEVEPVISMFIENGDTDIKMFDIPVKKAQLVCSPETLVVGVVTPITITYQDADGNPLEGYEVSVNDEDLGETDADGKVYYSASAPNGITYTFVAETDDKNDENSEIDDPTADNEDTIETKAKVKPKFDAEGPIATAPKIVNVNRAVIMIEDNVRVELAWITSDSGDERVDIKFPMKKIPHPVKLKKGANHFKVDAMDINNQFNTTELTIIYDPSYNPNSGNTGDDTGNTGNTGNTGDTGNTNPPSDKTVTFKIGEKTKYGYPVSKNGVTMVPVRFAQLMGAEMLYDGPTKTATYTLGSTVVKVTVGKMYAIVNGEDYKMGVPAYMNDEKRMMVPVRLVARVLGFDTEWHGNDKPITIKPFK